MTPRYRIVYSPTAYAELADIYAYIAQDSVRYAEAMVERILASIDLLSIFPRRHRVADSNGRLDGEVFSLPIRSYVVYFRISDEDSEVRIMRIRHSAQRSLKHF